MLMASPCLFRHTNARQISNKTRNCPVERDVSPNTTVEGLIEVKLYIYEMLEQRSSMTDEIDRK